MKAIPEVIALRAYTNVTINEETGCWISNYMRGGAGYAILSQKLKGNKASVFLAHRASWTHANGPIADGMTIDHICYTRMCVNPDHLRELSLVENSRRRNGEDWPLGQCKNGHDDSHQKEVTWGGHTRKMCQPCLDDRNAALTARRKAERRAA